MYITLRLDTDPGNLCPLGDAFASGLKDSVKILLAAGAPTDVYNDWGNAPVHGAAIGNRVNNLKHTLKRHPELARQATLHGRFLMHVAVAHRSLAVVEHLLEHDLAEANQPCTREKPKPLTHHLQTVEVTPKASVTGLTAELPSSSDHFVCVLGKFPNKQGLCYVEFEFLQHNSKLDAAVGIGIREGLLANLPGTTVDSYGYVSTSGLTYFGGSMATRQLYGPKYSKGDVIGVLWNRTYRTISYTKNGEDLGIAFRQVADKDMFAVVALTPGSKVRFNFGAKRFKANLDKLKVDQELRHGNAQKVQPFVFTNNIYPIHLAAYAQSREVIDVLIAKGATVNLPDSDKWTPLHYASLQGWTEGVEVLLASGAEVDAVTEYGSTPLLLAVENSHTQSATLLLNAGGDAEFVDSKKTTLLMLAAQDGNVEMMQALLDKGVSVKAKDKIGRTAMQYAANEDTATYLEAALRRSSTYREVYEINLQV